MTYFVGIDWADTRHDLCILNDQGQVVNEFAIAHSCDGFAQLHAVLQRLGSVQLNIERPNGLLVDFLLAHDYLVFVTVPFLVAHRRPHSSKNDRGDARLLAQLLRAGEPDCQRLYPSSPIAEQLFHLIRPLDQLRREQIRWNNRLVHALKLYYPVVPQLFRHTYQRLTLAFIQRFPDPDTARAATLDDLTAFFKSQRYCQPKRIPTLYQLLQQPQPRARDTVGHQAGVLAILPVLHTLATQIAALEKQIEQTLHQHPDAAWWLQLPGVGILTAARLIARIGDRRERFPTFQRLQAVAGTVPVTRRSGKQILVGFRRECSHPLRRAFIDLARHSLRSSAWAKAYYTQQRARGHSEQRAYRALANRWVKIIWTLWQRREPYAEAKHQANITTRAEPRPVGTRTP